ncbi:hypothetical protein CAPTEDRAFT_106235 [Capitella teleta]|uniref:Glycoside hydrolase family 3 N-terminal domain-containing protein n=1 Tax=Capitella teleta TaxID=283909 RepID=R7TLR6_CAPTE|nr:hypothetical protein CAPTEDRAFT_106235 [Capitella teleta]|eukprot:ELT94452.1 hypothetical protein CAPTEDRAFT_106235 [Capitella teleta]
MRHPLWGRNQETYGEDPLLSGTLAQSFVRGLQGDDPRYLRANAGCKHFDVHGGPEDIPVSRFSFDAKVKMRDWRMTFLPQFKMCVDAGSYSLMCSYNRINGIPACANKELLTDITRDEWGFHGYIVSDASAISNIKERHHYTNSTVATVVAAIKAGTNLELGSTYYTKQLDAMQQGDG